MRASSWRRELLGFVLLVLPTPLAAQTPCTTNCTVRVGQSFSLAFDASTSTDVTGYRVYLDTVKVGADIPATPGTTTVPSLSVSVAGSHTIEVSAFNAGGESPRVGLTFTALPTVPTPPANLRIVVAMTVAQDGSVTLTVLGVEQK